MLWWRKWIVRRVEHKKEGRGGDFHSISLSPTSLCPFPTHVILRFSWEFMFFWDSVNLSEKPVLDYYFFGRYSKNETKNKKPQNCSLIVTFVLHVLDFCRPPRHQHPAWVRPRPTSGEQPHWRSQQDARRHTHVACPLHAGQEPFHLPHHGQALQDCPHQNLGEKHIGRVWLIDWWLLI